MSRLHRRKNRSCFGEQDIGGRRRGTRGVADSGKHRIPLHDGVLQTWTGSRFEEPLVRHSRRQLGWHRRQDRLRKVLPAADAVQVSCRTPLGSLHLRSSSCRLIDVNEGEIRIDGVDTSSIGIDVLRKQLAVIPQDPVLFGGEELNQMSLSATDSMLCDAGTLRSNLDPWNEYSDASVWDVLQKVCLDTVATDIGGLEALISENGGNLSVGQRQLLCLAR